MGKLQEAQQKMEEVKDKLDKITVAGEAQGVKVFLNGMLHLKLQENMNLESEGRIQDLEHLTIFFFTPKSNKETLNFGFSGFTS